ncbi:hypothetical protein WJX84_006513 [Apatococcus fuscideae]|uniref:F-box domain-containing protein n=1 Tax=Apatococcus fuscideae TaxID=2026836 RepID=A0AAW1TF86_9CHLO
MPNDSVPASVPESDTSEAADLAEAMEALKQSELRAAQGPIDPGTGWGGLPEGIMGIILTHLDFSALKRVRLVSDHWRYAADRNLQELSPSRPKAHTIVAKFPSVTSIDFSSCQNMRNRNLSLLARRNLKLRSIAIGHASAYAYGKPRITNQALSSLAQMTGLQSLRLAECSAITNNGMAQLSVLTQLRSLAVMCCPRISDRGVAIAAKLPHLLHLNAYGCQKVTEQLLEQLQGHTQLETLQLGFTRIQSTGLRFLRALTNLRTLAFCAEDISSSSLTVYWQQSLGSIID